MSSVTSHSDDVKLLLTCPLRQGKWGQAKTWMAKASFKTIDNKQRSFGTHLDYSELYLMIPHNVVFWMQVYIITPTDFIFPIIFNYHLEMQVCFCLDKLRQSHYLTESNGLIVGYIFLLYFSIKKESSKFFSL